MVLKGAPARRNGNERNEEQSGGLPSIQSLFLYGNFPGNILLKRDCDPKTIKLALNPPANDPSCVPVFARSGFER